MTKPWDRRKTESLPAWTAFVIYRDLSTERSIGRTREALGRPTGYDRMLEEWSSKHEWVARAAAFDAAADARVQERVLQLRTEAQERRLNLARGLQTAAAAGVRGLFRDDGKTLKGPLKASEAAALAKVGAEMERLEDGDPTEVVKHVGGMNLEIRVVDVLGLAKAPVEPEEE